MMIGDSYVDNGNGTYTVQSATPLTYIAWYNSDGTTLRTYRDKYVCDGTNATCSNLKCIKEPNQYFYKYWGVENSYKYSESVSYSNGTYTLTGDIQTIWDVYDSTELAKITTHHYTCLNLNTTCTSVGYAYTHTATMYYLLLTGVNNINEAIVNMLSANNVNTKNSTMKTGIDAWYKKYLLPYDSYIDDTIYCNDRSINSLGGFNPNGGGLSTSISLAFNGYYNKSDLSCTNITDKFSVSNSSAQLTYKVGLMSSPEMELLYKNNIIKTGEQYWLITPTVGYWYGKFAYGRSVMPSGGWASTYFSNSYGVRPAVSLIPGTRYTEGDGSMANPYVILDNVGD